MESGSRPAFVLIFAPSLPSASAKGRIGLLRSEPRPVIPEGKGRPARIPASILASAPDSPASSGPAGCRSPSGPAPVTSTAFASLAVLTPSAARQPSAASVSSQISGFSMRALPRARAASSSALRVMDLSAGGV